MLSSTLGFNERELFFLNKMAQQRNRVEPNNYPSILLITF